jgi:hypothetical protein
MSHGKTKLEFLISNLTFFEFNSEALLKTNEVIKVGASSSQLTYTIFKSKIEEKGKILKETQPF